MKLRAFAESPRFCGLTLSPLMAAVMDAADGVEPTTIGDDEALAHFGCRVADLPRKPHRTVAVRGGGRSGKTSRLLAVKALHAAWTVRVPNLRRGEWASALLVGPDLKLGRQALSFVPGYIDASPVLRRALVGEPTKDFVELRRPDGTPVRIEVLAATRGGRAVRGRTLVFCGMDECAFFYDEASGVVNDADIFRAVLQRIADGGQCWPVSTPWLADVGLLEQLIAKNWGTHTTALAVTAPTRALNPTWDPDGSIERDLREQDPDAAIREIDGQPMSGGAGVFFSPEAIAACVDETAVLPLPHITGTSVSFGGDMGFVADSSALVGARKAEDDIIDIPVIEEQRPTKGQPLQPRVVITDFAATMRAYHAQHFVADGHYKLVVAPEVEGYGIEFVDAPAGQDGKGQVYVHAKRLIHEGGVRLPNHARLLSQLRSVVSRPLPGGGVAISIPRRRGAGHGDVASAFVLALWSLREDSAPSWVEAMETIRTGRRFGFEDDRPAVGYNRDGDRLQVWGNPPRFDSTMRASFHARLPHIHFSSNAPEAFKVEVRALRHNPNCK